MGIVEELLIAPHERERVEFKSNGNIGSSSYAAQIAKAAIAMANTQSGGYILVGIQDSQPRPLTPGIPESEISNWDYDRVSSKLATFSDPSVEFTIEIDEYNHVMIAVLRIVQFDGTPIMCVRDALNSSRSPITKYGAIYVRSGTPPSSVEAREPHHIRRLFQIATENGLREFLDTAEKAGGIVSTAESKSANDQYDHQARGFL